MYVEPLVPRIGLALDAVVPALLVAAPPVVLVPLVDPFEVEELLPMCALVRTNAAPLAPAAVEVGELAEPVVPTAPPV